VQIDFLIVCWAVHRIGGTCLLIQPTTSVPEIVSHMEKANCKALAICEELLPICKGIYQLLPTLPERTYTLTESPVLREALKVDHLKSLPQLLAQGRDLPKLPTRWMYEGDTSSEIAYLLATSGTSGRQVILLSFFLSFFLPLFFSFSPSLAVKTLFSSLTLNRDLQKSHTPTSSPT